jgi:hypothetical protein
MRVSILIVLIALIALTGRAEAQSAACVANTTATSSSAIVAAKSAIVYSGCTSFNLATFNPQTSSLCTNTTTIISGVPLPTSYTCLCNATISNDAYFVANVTAAYGQASGSTGSLQLTISLQILVGTTYSPLTLSLKQIGTPEIFFGGACNSSDISQALYATAQSGNNSAIPGIIAQFQSDLPAGTYVASTLSSASAFGITQTITTTGTPPPVSSSSTGSAASSSSTGSTPSTSSTGNTASSTTQVGAWTVAAMVVAAFAL